MHTKCIEAVGILNSSGYVTQYIEEKRFLAHRLVWIHQYGKIPKGFELDHKCSNKKCINIKHLELVTHAENMRRACSRKQELGTSVKRLCKRGHILTGLRTRSKGGRYCKECMRDNKKAWRKRTEKH
jgi:hypothetical protein